MKRRNFILNSSVLGGTLLLPPNIYPGNMLVPDGKNNSVEDKINKVKRAMLSMQRASWEQGVAMQSLLESGDYEMVSLMAKEAALRQTEEGRLSVLYTDNGVTDPGCSGEGVLYAAKLLNNEGLKKAAEKMLDYLINRAPKTETGILIHTLDAPEIWIDSMYMAPPFIAATGEYYEAVKQVKGIRGYLWNAKDKLFSHRWDSKKNEFINKSYWGVGNGWAMAGISRVLSKLPDNMLKEKKELIGYVKETIDGCIAHIRPDGLFHNVINDKNTFIETNLSQMVAYTIYTGIAGKWLDRSYIEYANKMREAAHKKVDEFGYVQDVCGAPEFESPGRATEGQAFFILMEAAYRKTFN